MVLASQDEFPIGKVTSSTSTSCWYIASTSCRTQVHLVQIGIRIRAQSSAYIQSHFPHSDEFSEILEKASVQRHHFKWSHRKHRKIPVSQRSSPAQFKRQPANTQSINTSNTAKGSKKKKWQGREQKRGDVFMLDAQESAIINPVMGDTGAGKSTFINTVVGAPVAIVGTSLLSCTANVQYFILPYLGFRTDNTSGRKFKTVPVPA
ncbi:hypothetical protein BJ138DRAFT_1221829 [Hygrophoropsis aurantiaca]|uniref:Uncharacterized protein n=1 Tax=Hygrophoropsis aurantiaca TaxID=72124 RepID=A0ACB8A0K9_9AGAM|nr:hypothetical protein BJ138DRAFT_1221829 [Hygrophoropsis aurantiaca]